MSGVRYHAPKAGDKLRDISSAGLRAAMQAGEAYESGQLGAIAGPSAANYSGSLFVVNATGKDLPSRSVVGIDAPLILPETDAGNPRDESGEQAFLNRGTMSVVKPSVEDHWESFGITKHAIPKDGTGTIVASGVAKVLVRIPLHAQHYTRAGFAEGDTEALHIHPGGACRILWRNETPTKHRKGKKAGKDTDLWWCIVQFDSTPEGWRLVRNKHVDAAPPYGVFQVLDSQWTKVKYGGLGIATPGARVYMAGYRPDTAMATSYAVNGPVTIQPGKGAFCHVGTDGDVWVRLRDNSSVSSEGWHDNWGPVPGQWYIGPHDDTDDKIASFGFEMQTNRFKHMVLDDNGTERRVLCRRFHPMTLQVRLAEDIDARSVVATEGQHLGKVGTPGKGRCEVYVRSGLSTGRFVTGYVGWLFWAVLETDSMAQVIRQPYGERFGSFDSSDPRDAYSQQEAGFRWNIDHASCSAFPNFVPLL